MQYRLCTVNLSRILISPYTANPAVYEDISPQCIGITDGRSKPRPNRISLSIEPRQLRRSMTCSHAISCFHSWRRVSTISENHVRLASYTAIYLTPRPISAAICIANKLRQFLQELPRALNRLANTQLFLHVPDPSGDRMEHWDSNIFLRRHHVNHPPGARAEKINTLSVRIFEK